MEKNEAQIKYRKAEASTPVDTGVEESTPVDKRELIARLGYDTTPENIFRDSWFVRMTKDGKVSFTSATPEQALDLYARVQKAGLVASSALKNYIRKLNQREASTPVDSGTEYTPFDDNADDSATLENPPRYCGGV